MSRFSQRSFVEKLTQGVMIALSIVDFTFDLSFLFKVLPDANKFEGNE